MSGKKAGRTLVAVITSTVLLAACGDQPLSNVGTVADRWLSGTEPGAAGQAPTTTAAPNYLLSADALEWVNDGLAGGDGNDVVAAVYQRGSSADAYHQASRAEIAVAVEGIRFPAEVPREARFVTSQLVYVPGTGSLNDHRLASFGLWAVEPYTVSRSVGQVATLMVANSAVVGAPSRTLEPCFDYSYGGTCSTVEFRGAPAWLIDSGTGRTLVWADGAYRYELFCRPHLDPDAIFDVADSMVGLASLGGR